MLEPDYYFFNDNLSISNLSEEYFFQLLNHSSKGDSSEKNDDNVDIPEEAKTIISNKDLSKYPENVNKDNEFKILGVKTYFTSERPKDVISDKENEKVKEKKGKIFKIVKIRRNMGRKPKIVKMHPNDKSQKEGRGIHNKYFLDNIIRKIKAKFFNALKDYINHIFVEGEKKKKHSSKIDYTTSGHFLVKVNQNFITDIKVNNVMSQLNSDLKFIFTFGTGEGKYKKYNNADIINKVYEKYDQRLINIFDLTFRESLSHFIGQSFYPQLEGFEKKYPEILQEMRESGENEDYIKKFQDTIETFEKKLEDKKPREVKTK